PFPIPALAGPPHRGVRMHIDATTLSDLEIFASPGEAGGLFELIYRTATSRGSSALRQRLKRPSSDAAAIRRTQDAVRFLQAAPGLVRLSEAAVAAVVRYLESNIAVESASPARDRI